MRTQPLTKRYRETGRLGSIYFGKDLHGFAVCIESVMLADIPKMLVCMHNPSTVPVPIYRFCCIKQFQASPLDPAN
jgi:hypothetical protein